METHKSNPLLVDLIRELKHRAFEQKAPIWKDVARRLARPSRNWPGVNVGKVSAVVKKGETALIPGKLLGAGELDRSLTIAAFSASQSARSKVAKAGGKVLSILELAEANPNGSQVRVVE